MWDGGGGQYGGGAEGREHKEPLRWVQKLSYLLVADKFQIYLCNLLGIHNLLGQVRQYNLHYCHKHLQLHKGSQLRRNKQILLINTTITHSLQPLGDTKQN